MLAVLGLYVVVLCLLPLLRLSAEATAAFSDASQIWRILSDAQVLRATGHTLEASFGSMLVSLAVGGGLALVIGLTDIRGKHWLVFLMLLPMLVPAQIAALAWLELTGPASTILGPLGLAPAPGSRNWLYSREGIVLLLGIEHSTMVFLAVKAGLRGLPRDLVEAAQVAGAGRFRIVRSIVLPLLRPSLLAGAALAFVAAVGNFGIPAILGIPGRYTMLTALIYQRLSGFGPSALGEVAVLSIILVVIVGVGLSVQLVADRRRQVVVAGDGTAITPFSLGRWRSILEIAIVGILLVISVMPLLALLGTSLVQALGLPLGPDTVTLEHYVTVLRNAAARRGFLNSAWLALGAAGVTLVVALPFAFLVALRRSRVATILNLAADAPFAIPGTVVSIAFILAFLPPLPLLKISLYGTAAILLLAYLARFLALGLKPAIAGMMQLDPALEEAARIVGAGGVRRLVSVILPLAAPAAAAGALLVVMSAYNELTVSALLWSAGHETIGVMIFNLYDEGNATAASAASVMAVLVTLLAAGAASLLAHRMPRGVLPWQT
ncbi:ABC transporter permease [Dongia sp.]|uniref:ABC transporter permease n=1 Tax=Dongia sp. TaxID=1977262 RepID=UPI0035AF89D8